MLPVKITEAEGTALEVEGAGNLAYVRGTCGGVELAEKPRQLGVGRTYLSVRRWRMPKEYINPPSLFESRENGFSQAVAASGTRTL